MLPLTSRQARPSSSVVIGDDDELPPTVSTEDIIRDSIKVLKAFSSSGGVKSLVCELTASKRRLKFANRINILFDSLGKTDYKTSEHLTLACEFVLQSAEDYLYCDDEAARLAICMNLLCPRFFEGNTVLCIQYIDMVKPFIKKSTLWRRNSRLLSHLFFWLLARL